MLNFTKVERHPNGEWVLFLHGIGGGSNIWSRQIRDFRKHFNLLFIDLPGHGESKYGLGDMKEQNFDSIAEEILRVMDKEGIQSAHFVGISLGTIIIQKLHELVPKRVLRMVLGGAVEGFNRRGKLIIGAAEVMKRWVPYMWLYKICAIILMPRAHHGESRVAFVKEAYKLGKKEFLLWMRLHRHVEGAVRSSKQFGLTTPKLYLMGSEDYMFLPGVRKGINKEKNEVLSVIEKCGHVCNIECHTAFNEQAISFLLEESKTKIY